MTSQASRYTSAALETVSLVTGSSQLSIPALLLGLVAENTDSQTNYVQVFDGYAAPTAGAVPLVSLKTAAGVQISLEGLSFYGLAVSKGIVLALSSTGPTYTAVANKMFVTAWYRNF